MPDSPLLRRWSTSTSGSPLTTSDDAVSLHPTLSLHATFSTLHAQDASLTPVLDQFDYCFAENGLTAYKLGQPLTPTSFIKHLGEEEYKKLVNFILHYIADLDIPIKR